MAMELATHGIRVNSYCPGIHDTKMWEEVDEELGKLQGRPKGESIKKYCSELIALKRCGTPSDVAKLVCFLARDESEYMYVYQRARPLSCKKHLSKHPSPLPPTHDPPFV